MPVASAAPAISIRGKGPMPKINNGSSTIFVTNPAIMLTMVARIRPTAWNIFSSVIPPVTMTENRNTTLEYSMPSARTVSLFVNIPKNKFIPQRNRTMSSTPCNTPSTMPWVAVLSAFS
jgi:hypothetical protein